MTDETKHRKAVAYIIIFKFCEKFCFYGVKTILVLFISEKLKLDEADSKITIHAFFMLVYFSPIIGGVVSDSYLGKYKTIVYASITATSGYVLLVLSAADPIKIPRRASAMLALLFMALGSGANMPCIAALGGDQFVMPEQAEQLDRFFSIFYLSINVGSMIATMLTPILRSSVRCFGEHNCYTLGFAVPTVFMFLAILVLMMGKSSYRHVQPKGNILIDVVKCITYALTHKRTEDPEENHWLDKSKQKYGPELVRDIKVLLQVLVLYIPIPVFWALYDQEGSGWILQAVKMNGDCGFFTIFPDQMQVLNPLMILPLIPLFSYVVYPAFAKCGLLKKPLQKITLGGFMAALSFLLSAVVSLALEASLPVLPAQGEAHVRIYDPTSCTYSFSTADNVIPAAQINGYHLVKSVKVPSGGTTVNFTFFTDNSSSCQPREMQMEMEEKTSYGVYITDTAEGHFKDSIQKTDDGFPLIRAIVSDSSIGAKFTHISERATVDIGPGDVTLHTLDEVGIYKLDIVTNTEFKFKLGGTYTILINKESNKATTISVVDANSIHILWLVPQYFTITVAEILLGITGLTFSYEEAPIVMKSVIQAGWYITSALGNLLIIVVEALKLFELQSLNFLVYTGLMVADTLLFMILAIRYKSQAIYQASETPS